MLSVGEISRRHTIRRFITTERIDVPATKPPPSETPVAASAALEDYRDALRQWITEGVARTKDVKSPSGLARKSGVAVSTVTNFLNDPDYTYTLTLRTLTALERVIKSPAPRPPAGFEESMEEPPPEPEAEQVDLSSLPKGLQGAIRELQAETKGLEVWRLLTYSLTKWGYHFGDYVLIDTQGHVNANDLAFAIKDATTPLFRVYHKPWLVNDEDEPLLVDDRKVILKGKPVGRISWPS
jgi:hypothetical protein